MRVLFPTGSITDNDTKYARPVSQAARLTGIKSLTGDQVQFKGAGQSAAEKDSDHARDEWEKIEQSQTASQQEKDKTYKKVKKKAGDSQRVKRHIAAALGLIPGAGALAGHVGNAVTDLTDVDKDGNNVAYRNWNAVAKNSEERDAIDRASGIDPNNRRD